MIRFRPNGKLISMLGLCAALLSQEAWAGAQAFTPPTVISPRSVGSPDAASDRGDRFVLAWVELGRGVVAQRFDAAGRRVGTTFTVDPAGTLPRVAMDAAGRFVVTWSYSKVDGTSCIGGRRYAENGRTLGRLSLDYCTSVNASPYPATAVAATPDGRFVVAWSQAFADNENSRVFLQRFAATGRPVSSPIVVSRPAEQNHWWQRPAVAMDDAGNVTVAWSGWEGAAWDTPMSVFVRTFDAAGRTRNAGFRQRPEAPLGRFDGVWAAASGARTAILWEDLDASWQRDVWVGRVLGANGGPGGPAVHIDTSSDEVHGYPGDFAPAMDASGRLALVWEGDIFDDPGIGVRGQIFDAEGRSLGPIPIQSSNGTAQDWTWAGSPAVAFGEGVLLTAWVEQRAGLKAQFFRVR